MKYLWMFSLILLASCASNGNKDRAKSNSDPIAEERARREGYDQGREDALRQQQQLRRTPGSTLPAPRAPTLPSAGGGLPL